MLLSSSIWNAPTRFTFPSEKSNNSFDYLSCTQTQKTQLIVKSIIIIYLSLRSSESNIMEKWEFKPDFDHFFLFVIQKRITVDTQHFYQMLSIFYTMHYFKKVFDSFWAT